MITQLPENGYKDIFYNSEATMLIVSIDSPHFTVIDVNNAYLKATNSTREALVGSSLFTAFPQDPSDKDSEHTRRTVTVFDQAIHTKKVVIERDYRFDIQGLGANQFEERWWTATNTPVLNEQGEVSYIIHSPTDITELHHVTERERKNEAEALKAHKLLEEAEERARLTIDAVGLGTYDLDLVTNEIITSPRGANILGFDKPVSRDEYVASFHPDDIQLRNKAHEEALKTGRLIYEIRVIWQDKSLHWIRLEGKVIFGDDGIASRIIGTLLDITEQRTAMEEQRKLITLVDNSVDLMSILNLEGVNSYINKAGINLLGFDNVEHVAHVPVSALHDPAHFAQVEQEVLPNVMSKGRWEGTMLVRHLKSGEIFPVYNNCIRIDDPVSGAPIAVGAVMRDLRPEIAAKQALADSEQLLRNITSATPTTLWMSDKAGSVTYVNQAWLDWTGREYAKHLGSGWLNSIHQADRQKVAEKLTDIDTKGLFEVEFRLNHADGTTHWCMLTGQPQYDARNKFAGYIGSCVDITDQKLLQQQKDDFIGIASHELKTPVTSIKAYTQVLERMLMRKGDIKEAGMIGKMDAQINRLTSLIGDLLDVTKINSGKLQFNDTEFDFVPMVRDLVEDLQRTTEKHTLIEHHAQIGMIYGDKERIGQVISNLITNAIKYSPQADKIIVSTCLVGNEVELCVQDFGIGISKDKLQKVFEQFYRVSGDMQHTFPGLGLGLYISSEIIKREGGRIWVNSEVGKGSKFCFAIPLHDSVL